MGLVEALLALALIGIVPVGLRLHPDVTLHPAVIGPVGLLAGLSLDWEQGAGAAMMVVPWLAVTGGLAALSAWRWLARRRTLASLPWTAALVYLAVGAAWLVLHRFGAEPVGITEPFVQLTAVHFHYAGFTATLLAALVRERTSNHYAQLSTAMLAAIVVAPPIVAAGFTFAGVLQVVGATVLTLGLFALAWLTLRGVVPNVDDRIAKVLLIVSALAVLVPMILAVQWAIGWNYGTPALSIPAMARTHGVVNALGFALCGVVGWRRLGRIAIQGGNDD